MKKNPQKREGNTPLPIGLPVRALAGLIRLYQIFLSPLKYLLAGPNAGCRFYPTCSHYARESLLRHGVFAGGYLAVCRLVKCHPFHSGGCDPVPDNPPTIDNILRRSNRGALENIPPNRRKASADHG